MDPIIPNLSFEVVAVPQNAVPTATSYSTPIKVKIKMKKGDNNGVPRQGMISVPKMRPINPETTRKVHSDETIMSFNILMEPESQSKPHRKSQNKFFHIFKTGKCLDTQGDDEYDPPYMLATAGKSNNVKSDRLLIESHDRRDKISLSKDKFNTKTSKNTKHNNVVFGNCKPGGCLDPPFGEDKYQYYPYTQSKQELKVKQIENFQKPHSENLDEDKEKSKILEIAVTNSDYNESDASSTYMLYRADSNNKILNEKYSDSIITYPAKISSGDLSILEKNITSRKSSSVKNNQLIDTYFKPIKIRKSQEKKRESINKRNTNRDNSQKECAKDKSSCNIPISEHVEVKTLLKDSNDNIEEKNKEINSQKLITQTNYKTSQLIDISGNILLTVNEIKEPIDSVKSILDAKNMESELDLVKDIDYGYRSIDENITSKTVDVTSGEVSISKSLNSSPLIISEEPLKLNEISIINSNNSIQVFSKKIVDNEDDHYVPSNYNEEKLKLLPVESEENATQLLNKEIELHKQVTNITSENEFDTKDKQHPRILQYIQENIKKEEMEKSPSDISLCQEYFKEVKPLESNLTTEKLSNFKSDIFNLDINKPTEQFDNYFLDHSNVDKVSDKYFRNSRDLNVNSTIEIDNGNALIYSDYSKDYLTEKNILADNLTHDLKDLCSDSLTENNQIKSIDNKIILLKDISSFEKLDTIIGTKSVIKDEHFSDISPPNNVEIIPSDISSLKNDIITSLITSIRNRSNDNLLQNNNIIIERNISEMGNITTLDQFIENTTALTHENIPDNSPLDNDDSRYAEITSSITLTNKDDTASVTSETNSTNNNNSLQNMNTDFVNQGTLNILGIQNTIKPENESRREEDLKSDTFFNPPINLIPSPTEYTILNTSSPIISMKNEINAIQVYKNESELPKVSKSNEIVNDTSIRANLHEELSENILSELENPPLDIIKQNISYKANLFETSKYPEANNDLNLLYDSSPKENSRLSQSPPDPNSNQSPLPTMMSLNTKSILDTHTSLDINNTRKEEQYDIQQPPNAPYYNELSEITDDDMNVPKNIGSVALRDTKRNKSNTSLKIFTNKPIIVDLAFQTYVNENGDTILKTFDAPHDPQRFAQDKIFVTRSVLKLNDSKILFAINSDTKLSIKVLQNTNNSNENKSFKLKEYPTEDATCRTYRNNEILSNVTDVSMLQELLSAVYENDLIPIERLIKSLRLEIDRMVKYRHLMRKKSITSSKKLKPSYSKRCVCTKKWNING